MSRLRILAWLFLVCQGLPALDLRPYAGPDAPLYATLTQTHQRLVQDLVLQAYRTHGQRDPRWDDEVEWVLTAAAGSLAKAGTPASEAEGLRRAEALIRPPLSCSEPLVLWAGFQLARNAGWKIRHPWCDRANRAWEKRRKETQADLAPEYPAVLQALTLCYMLGTYNNGTSEKAKRVLRENVPLVAAAWREVWRRQELLEAPELLMEIINILDPETPELADALFAAQTAGMAGGAWPAWGVDGANACLRVETAWAWRGDGWASTVKEEGWARFRADLDEAAILAERSWQAKPCARLASAAISIAGGRGSDEGEQWFLRSISACFDRPTTWQARAYFLMPRWGGSFDQLLQHGLDALATERFDTVVPWEVVQVVSQALKDAKEAPKMEQLRARMHALGYDQALERCFATYEAQDPSRAGMHAAVRAAMAHRLGRMDEARKWLAKAPPEACTSSLAKKWGVKWDDLHALDIPVEGDPSRF